MNKLKTVMMLLMAVMLFGCGDSKVNEMESNLLYSGGKEKHGTWVTNYPDEFNSLKLWCKEKMTLFADGKFKQESEYYLDGNLVATISIGGTWKITTEGDGRSYYFEQEYNDKLAVNNVNFEENWFRAFDTEMRIRFIGDYEDSGDEDEEESTMPGYGIVDCTPDLFIIQTEDGETYRYEKANE